VKTKGFLEINDNALVQLKDKHERFSNSINLIRSDKKSSEKELPWTN
jgi:hypothetical protein